MNQPYLLNFDREMFYVVLFFYFSLAPGSMEHRRRRRWGWRWGGGRRGASAGAPARHMSPNERRRRRFYGLTPASVFIGASRTSHHRRGGGRVGGLRRGQLVWNGQSHNRIVKTTSVAVFRQDFLLDSTFSNRKTGWDATSRCVICFVCFYFWICCSAALRQSSLNL